MAYTDTSLVVPDVAATGSRRRPRVRAFSQAVWVLGGVPVPPARPFHSEEESHGMFPIDISFIPRATSLCVCVLQRL